MYTSNFSPHRNTGCPWQISNRKMLLWCWGSVGSSPLLLSWATVWASASTAGQNTKRNHRIVDEWVAGPGLTRTKSKWLWPHQFLLIIRLSSINYCRETRTAVETSVTHYQSSTYNHLTNDYHTNKHRKTTISFTAETSVFDVAATCGNGVTSGIGNLKVLGTKCPQPIFEL